MNHNDYRWSNPQMLRYEMHEGALEQARLLQKLGLTYPGWLARALTALGKSLKIWRKAAQARHAFESK